MNKTQLTDFQRIENVKNFYKIPSWRQFASIIGVNGGQIFTNIKQKKNTISANIARKICQSFPQVSYEYLMEGSGEMLRPATNDHGIVNSGNIGGNATVQNNNNETPTLSVLLERITENLEQQQTERERLLSIIENQQQQLTQLINIQIKQQ